MRIVHVTTFLHPEHPGGAERLVASLSRAQADAGHDVTVVTSGVPDAAPRERRDGVRIVRHPVEPRVRGARFLLAVARGTRRTLSTLSTQSGDRFDVLHAHQVGSASAALAARDVARRRVFSFYAPYGAERAVERGAGPIERVRNAAASALDRRCLARAELIHVLSDFSAAQVATIAPTRVDRVRTIRPGVDTAYSPGSISEARARLSLPLDGARLFTVRRLVKRMGLDDAVDAVGSLVSRGADVCLDIAGAGPEEASLRDRIHGHGLEERVRLLGRVEEEALADHYRAADLFLLPTRALEGFGMVTLEALASGTPVIATDVGATPEVLGHWLPDAPCVAPGAAPLSAAIMSGLERREPLRRAARAAADRLRVEANWSVVAQRMTELYREES